MQIQRKVKALISAGALMATPLAYTHNEFIVNHSTIVKAIKASNFVPYRIIPKKSIIIISYENLLKLMDSGKLTQKQINIINSNLLENSFNDYKSGNVYNFNINDK
ncbi:MAG: hypothetical protein LBF00_02105 [Mycoplasmataceae bacterium]|jgi:hypothetical protein|nr:hypothetical protein [Mycoplasmataceae bacterium]